VTQILDEVSESFKETMKAFVGGKDTVKQDFDRKVSTLGPFQVASQSSSPHIDMTFFTLPLLG
jgi:hypothetical protein